MTFHWLCLDFTVKTKSMLLHNFQMTFSWLFYDFLHDFQMTSYWLWMTIPWPFLDFFLTLIWPSSDFCLTFTWLVHDLCLTFTWPLSDLFLTYIWLLYDFALTKTWPQQSKKSTKSQGKVMRLYIDCVLTFIWLKPDLSSQKRQPKVRESQVTIHWLCADFCLTFFFTESDGWYGVALWSG